MCSSRSKNLEIQEGKVVNKMEGRELLERLKEILSENNVSRHQFAWDDIEESTRDVIVAELGEYEVEQDPLRTEGDGDFNGAQAVFHFPLHGVYVSVEGYYMSDDGMTFEDFDVVEPKEITTTIY